MKSRWGGQRLSFSLSLIVWSVDGIGDRRTLPKAFFWEVDCIHREADEELQTLFTADFTTLLDFFLQLFCKTPFAQRKESERERKRERAETKDKQSVHGKDTLVCMEKTNVTDYISICTHPPTPTSRYSLLHTPKMKSWKMSWKKKKKHPPASSCPRSFCSL